MKSVRFTTLLWVLALFIYVGPVVFLCGYWVEINFDHWIIQHLKYWQDLIGAIIGASAAILVVLGDRILKRRAEYTAAVVRTDKSLILSLDNTLTAKREINKFIKRLDQVITWIDMDSSSGNRSLAHAFFPYLENSPILLEVLNFTSGSRYVDQEIMHVVNSSRVFALAFEDAKRQFESTVEINRTIALQSSSQGLTRAQIIDYNNKYKDSISDFKVFLQENLLKKNIPAYIRIIIQTRVAVRRLHTMGLLAWRVKYDPRYGIFLSEKDRKEYESKAVSNITDDLKLEIDKEFDHMVANG